MTNYGKYLFFSILFLSAIIFAQKKDLTFEQAYLYGEPRLTKSLPSVETWGNENSYLIREGQKIKIVNLLSREESILLDYDEIKSELPEGFGSLSSATRTEDYSKFILEKDNDIYLYERENKELIRLTNDENLEKNPTFSPDGSSIAYTKNNNLFVLNFKNEKEVQLTHDGSDVILNG